MQGSRRTLAAGAVALGLFGASCGGTDFARPRRRASRRTPRHARARAVAPNPALQTALVRSAALTSAAKTARTAISVTLTGLGDDALATGSVRRRRNGRRRSRQRRRRPLAEHPALRPARRWRRDRAADRRRRRVRQDAGRRPARRRSARVGALAQSRSDTAWRRRWVDAVAVAGRPRGPARVPRRGLRRRPPGRCRPVRGVPATHFAATIDLAGDAPGVRRVSGLGARLAPLGAVVGSGRLAVDVWLDGAGRARRVVVSLRLSARSAASDGPGIAGLGPEAMMRIQADFYGFGAPVRVAAPPKAQVRPYSSLRIGTATG